LAKKVPKFDLARLFARAVNEFSKIGGGYDAEFR
jgi:hypothetical protein